MRANASAIWLRLEFSTQMKTIFFMRTLSRVDTTKSKDILYTRNAPMSEPSQSFLQRRPLRRALGRALRNWLERHQHPFNRGIHLIGIQLALLGVVLFFTLPWNELF